MARDNCAGLLCQTEEGLTRAQKAMRMELAEGLEEISASLASAIMTDALDSGETQVCWMATGREVCSLPTTPSSRVADLKASIQQHSGVQAEEQRLFGADEKELKMDDLVSGHPILYLVRSAADPRVSDLGHFRPSCAHFEPLASGNFTIVGKIAQGINGDIFRYKWRRDGEGQTDVTVKKLRVTALERQLDTERDERKVHMMTGRSAPEAEDALTEIGVLSYLARQPDLPSSLLRILGVYSAPNYVWLATEFCNGGDLFEVAAAGSLQEGQVRGHMQQLLEAVAYLHRHHIGHRDVSLENVLLKGAEVKLMDFGMSVRSHSCGGVPLRFFRAVGKNYYRAPECYIPPTAEVRVPAVPAGASPGDVVAVRAAGGYLCEVKLPADASSMRPCQAEVWGYAASLADVFSSGVCLFILLTGCPPFGRAMLADALFSYLTSQGKSALPKLLKSWQKQIPSEDVMQLMGSMMQPESSERPTVEECLASPWFVEPATAPAAVHESSATAVADAMDP